MKNVRPINLFALGAMAVLLAVPSSGYGQAPKAAGDQTPPKTQADQPPSVSLTYDQAHQVFTKIVIVNTPISDLVPQLFNAAGVQGYVMEPLPITTFTKTITNVKLTDLATILGIGLKHVLPADKQDDASKQNPSLGYFLVYTRSPAPAPANIVRLYDEGNLLRLNVSSAPLSSVLSVLKQLGNATFADNSTVSSTVMVTNVDIVGKDGNDLLSQLQNLTGVKITRAADMSFVISKPDVPAKDPKVTAVYPLVFTSSPAATTSAAAQTTKPAASADTKPAAASAGGGTSTATAKTASTPDSTASTPVTPATPTTPAAPASSGGTAIETLLGKLLPNLTVNQLGRNVVMNGSSADISAAKELLARYIDIPYSQIRVDAWAIQTNTSVNRRSLQEDQMRRIRRGIRIAQTVQEWYIGKVAAFIRKQQLAIPEDITLRLNAIGYDTSPNRTLTAADRLIFLMFIDPSLLATELGSLDTSGLMANIRKDVATEQSGVRVVDPAVDKLIGRLETALKSPAGQLPLLIGTMGGPSAFDIVAGPDGDNSPRFNRRTFSLFLADLVTPDPTQNKGYSPERFTRRSAAVDSMLKAGSDALARDLENLFTITLIDWIRDPVNGPQMGSDLSMDLVGNISIVASSSTQASVTGSATSYVRLPPKAFEASDLANNPFASIFGGGGSSSSGAAAPSKAAGAAAATAADAATGGMTALSQIISSVVLAESVPAYGSISPGISLTVRPTQMVDDGSARVQLTLSINDNLDTSTYPDNRGGTPDFINGHNMTSDLHISDFELAELSTFGMQTTRLGDYLWQIPVLEGIPFLGEMFHGRRAHVTKRQESLLLMDVIITPTSMDLAKSYNSVVTAGGPKGSGSNKP